MRPVIAQNTYGAATNRAAEADATLWETRLSLGIFSVRLKKADQSRTAVPIARPRMNQRPVLEGGMGGPNDCNWVMMTSLTLSNH